MTDSASVFRLTQLRLDLSGQLARDTDLLAGQRYEFVSYFLSDRRQDFSSDAVIALDVLFAAPAQERSFVNVEVFLRQEL
jgi:hypothetical protein